MGSAPALLAFSVPDTHIHLLLACDRKEAGRFVNHLLGGLVRGLSLEGGFAPAWFGAVESQGHLRSTLHYVLRQHDRHDTRHDPFREASNLQDLLGLRTLGAFTREPVHRLLPRLRGSQILPHLGVESLAEGSDPNWLVEAGAAAIGADSLGGKKRATRAARIAAAHWARSRGYTSLWLAERLGARPRSVNRLLQQTPEPALLRAIGLQLGLREQRSRSTPRLSA